MKKKYLVLKKISIYFLVIYFIITFGHGAFWYVKKTQFFVSEEEATRSCFLPTGSVRSPHVNALKERPFYMNTLFKGWRTAYVYGINSDYITKGYLHLGITTEQSEQINLLIKDGTEDLKFFVERLSFLVGIPVVAFSAHVENKIYTLKDIEITGYFRVTDDKATRYWSMRE